MILSTSPNISGENVIKTIGIVKGSTIRTRHIGHDMLSGLKTLIGGELDSYTKMLNDSRQQALDRMVKEAEEQGADAIISLRFTSSAIMQGASEILVYGTAVKIEKNNG